MSEPVRIHIDLSTGAVEVSAPAEAIDSIFARLESFIPQISEAYGARNNGGESEEGFSASEEIPAAQTTDVGTTRTEKSARTRKSGGKRETYNIVDLGLDEAQREALRSFFASKNPKGQNDQTLVLLSWLADNTDTQAFGWNEIYTAFRLINGLKVPGKISSVLGNMVGHGLISNAGGGKYRLTHVGEDRVRLELPVNRSS
jgi:hypothetical protein